MHVCCTIRFEDIMHSVLVIGGTEFSEQALLITEFTLIEVDATRYSSMSRFCRCYLVSRLLLSSSEIST
jgi:hypothetical protein